MWVLQWYCQTYQWIEQFEGRRPEHLRPAKPSVWGAYFFPATNSSHLKKLSFLLEKMPPARCYISFAGCNTLDIWSCEYALRTSSINSRSAPWPDLFQCTHDHSHANRQGDRTHCQGLVSQLHFIAQSLHSHHSNQDNKGWMKADFFGRLTFGGILRDWLLICFVLLL